MLSPYPLITLHILVWRESKSLLQWNLQNQIKFSLSQFLFFTFVFSSNKRLKMIHRFFFFVLGTSLPSTSVSKRKSTFSLTVHSQNKNKKTKDKKNVKVKKKRNAKQNYKLVVFHFIPSTQHRGTVETIWANKSYYYFLIRTNFIFHFHGCQRVFVFFVKCKEKNGSKYNIRHHHQFHW